MSKRRSPLRIGIVGLGRIGFRHHAPRLHTHKDFVLAAVADTATERCREAEAAFGCASFEDYGEMLANAKLDAVLLASPTHLHAPMALAAFRRGLHVLLEKPMAADYREAQAIARAAKRANRVLTVYQPHRLRDYFQTVLKVLRSGRLGKVFHVKRAHYAFSRRDDWQALRKYGGGMLRNSGAHGADQLLAITGSNIKRVFCQLRRVASLGDAEDVVKMVYETREGVLGELEINHASLLSPPFSWRYTARTAASVSRMTARDARSVGTTRSDCRKASWTEA